MQRPEVQKTELTLLLKMIEYRVITNLKALLREQHLLHVTFSFHSIVKKNEIYV